MNIETLTMMANQIARNVPARNEEGRIAAAAAHIREYWEPRMVQALMGTPDGLDPLARAALIRLNAAAR